MRKWIPFFLIIGIMASGCLEAKLTAGEVALCMHAASGELARIPTCTTQSACQLSFRKAQPSGAGSELGVSMLVERAEDEAIRGWISSNAAAQQMEKLKRACQTGNLGNILDLARQAGNEWGNALARSEKSQVLALEAEQQALRNAESLELGLVRDSHAFQSYARAAELVQEIETDRPTSDLAKKIHENKNYFSSAAKTLTGRESDAYAIDIASGFDLLKTPTKILEPGNKGRLIIAFFPAWESFLGSVRTRKNVSAGLKALEEINIGELVYHLEQGVGPAQGIHAELIRHIREMERGIIELKTEIATFDGGVAQGEERLQGSIQSLHERIEGESAWRIELEKWKPTGEGNTLDEIKEKVEQSKEELNQLASKRYHARELENKKEIALGKSVLLRREHAKGLFALDEKLAHVSAAMQEQEKTCVDLATEIKSEKEARAETILAAKEVVEARQEDIPRYCGNFLQVLGAAARLTRLPQEELRLESELKQCVEKVNSYFGALSVSGPISLEQWLVQDQHSLALARDTCHAALLNVETAYAGSSQMREWQALAARASEWTGATSWLLTLNLRVGEKEKIEGLEKELLPILRWNEEIFSEKELIEKNEKNREIIRKAKKIVTESLQAHVNTIEWKIARPEVLEANQISAVSAEWEINLPFRIEDSLSSIAVRLPEGLHVIESNGVWEQDGNVVMLRYAAWPQRMWVRAQGELEGVSTEERDSWGELIGNEATIRTEINIKTPFPGSTAWVQWNGGSGVQVKNPFVHREHDSTAIVLRNGNEFLLELQKAEEMIIAEGTLSNAVESEIDLSHRSESDTASSLTYLITIRNHLGKKIRIDETTGVRINPIETLGVSATDERGNSLPWKTSTAGALVIEGIELAAKAERHITLIVTQLQGNEGWEAQWGALQEGLRRLTGSRFGTIASRAQALLLRVGSFTADPAEWVLAIPKWQVEYENLLREENVAWQRAEMLMKRKKGIEEGNKIEGWSEQLSAAATALERGNLDAAETTIAGIEKERDQDAIETNNSTIQVGANVKKEMLGRIAALGETLLRAEEDLSAYAREQSVSCAKLLETNFVCPLSENQAKDLKGEWSDLQKKNRAVEKSIEKLGNDAVEWPLITKEIEKNEAQLLRMQQRIEHARAALSDSAQEIQVHVRATTTRGKEWEDSAQKMEVAMEEREYGKAIYIGRNLLRFAAEKTSLATGLSIFPEKVWPLAGVIVAAGGMGVFRWWKRKKSPAIEPKQIPKGDMEKIILPQSQEKAYGGSSLLNRKKESPPVSLAQTKP